MNEVTYKRQIEKESVKNKKEQNELKKMIDSKCKVSINNRERKKKNWRKKKKCLEKERKKKKQGNNKRLKKWGIKLSTLMQIDSKKWQQKQQKEVIKKAQNMQDNVDRIWKTIYIRFQQKKQRKCEVGTGIISYFLLHSSKW